MNKAYPIILEVAEEGGFLVYCPDFDIYTQGSDYADALYMARDAISLKGVDLIEDKKSVPEPSELNSIDADGGVKLLVDVDFEKYRREYGTKSVRKNCTIPEWLNDAASEAGLNFSKVLQDGLKRELEL